MDGGQLALLICLVLIGVLGGLVGLLWFQLWLSRRDVNLMRRLQYVAPLPDPEENGGCLGGLLGPVVLFLVGLLVWAAYWR